MEGHQVEGYQMEGHQVEGYQMEGHQVEGLARKHNDSKFRKDRIAVTESSIMVALPAKAAMTTMIWN